MLCLSLRASLCSFSCQVLICISKLDLVCKMSSQKGGVKAVEICSQASMEKNMIFWPPIELSSGRQICPSGNPGKEGVKNLFQTNLKKGTNTVIKWWQVLSQGFQYQKKSLYFSALELISGGLSSTEYCHACCGLAHDLINDHEMMKHVKFMIIHAMHCISKPRI